MNDDDVSSSSCSDSEIITKVGDAASGLAGADLAAAMYLRILYKLGPTPKSHLLDHKLFLRTYKFKVGRIAPLPSTKHCIEAIDRILREGSAKFDATTGMVSIHRIHNLPKFWYKAPRTKEWKVARMRRKQRTLRAALIFAQYLEVAQVPGKDFLIENIPFLMEECERLGIVQGPSAAELFTRGRICAALYDMKLEKWIVEKEDGSLALTEFYFSHVKGKLKA